MSSVRKLFAESSSYFIGNLFVILAGFISFPIMTRIFTPKEYGVFSLAVVSIGLGVSVAKFGLQHSALRFYEDFKENKYSLKEISYYYMTPIFGVAMINFIIIAINAVILGIVRKHLDGLLLTVIPLIGVIIFFQSLNNLIEVFLRAERRGVLFNIITVAGKYGSLFLSLFIVFYLYHGLFGFLTGMAISEGAILFFLLFSYRDKLDIKKISFPFLKESLRFGFPLIWMELANLILSFGDRYLIEYYMGSSAVGIYSVGYNISTMAQSVLALPLRLAIIPMYLSVWSTNGETETRKFLNNALNYYFLLGIPIIIGLSLMGKDIVNVMATKQYEGASVIIPYIIFPLIIYGGYAIFASGLFIHKKTLVIMYITIFAAALNILLNIFLIPRLGLIGSALATLIAYLFLVGAIIVRSSSYLKLDIKISSILKYMVLSAAVVLLVSRYLITGNVNIHILMLKVSVIVIIYFAGIFIMEKDIREKTMLMLARRIR